MPALPAEISYTSEETTVIGDVEAFMTYFETGQALADWHERITAQTAECDAFLREHSHVWGHIIIQGAVEARPLPRAA